LIIVAEFLPRVIFTQCQCKKTMSSIPGLNWNPLIFS